MSKQTDFSGQRNFHNKNKIKNNNRIPNEVYTVRHSSFAQFCVAEIFWEQREIRECQQDTEMINHKLNPLQVIGNQLSQGIIQWLSHSGIVLHKPPEEVSGTEKYM